MPLFQYKAVSPSGETLRGEMEAASSQEVIARLQEQGNLPISADEAGSGIRFSFGGGGRLSANDIRDLTGQLSILLGAGLPLDRALTVMSDLSEGERSQKVVDAIRDQVRGGSSLSEALEAQHGTFNRLYTNMVRAGEVGGSLDTTLERLSDYLARSKELKDTIISAMIYPMILLLMAIGSVILLLTFVVPQFMPIFEDLGADLPLMTAIVLGAGEILQSYWWLIAIVIAALVYGFRRQMAEPDSRRRWDARFLRWRIVGDLIRKIETARLSRTVGTLLVNGVPLLSALGIGRRTMTNTVLAEGVDQAAEEVKTGGSLAVTLSATKQFPKLALQMINVGEETGKLDDMLVRVADTYDREVRVTVERALALLVPLLTLSLAGLIAVIVLSLLMAIFSINDMVA